MFVLGIVGVGGWCAWLGEEVVNLCENDSVLVVNCLLRTMWSGACDLEASLNGMIAWISRDFWMLV